MCFTSNSVSNWLTVISSFVLHLVTQGIAESFGVIYTELLDYFNAGKAETSWIISLCFGLLLAIGPVAGYLADKFGCWILAIFGSILAAGGMVCSMFVQDLHYLYITNGCITGVGFGFAFMVASLSVTLQFHEHKWQSSAIAFATSGANTGIMVIPLLSQLFLTDYGWRGTFLLLAGITLQGVICGIMLINLRNKEMKRKKETTEKITGDNSFCENLKEIFQNADFVLFMISGSLTSLGFLIPYVMIPDMVKEKGFTNYQGALIITVSGITGIIGRLLAGALIDILHLSRLVVHVAALLIGSIATALYVHMEYYWMMIVYGGILGAFTGIFGFLQPAITNDLLRKNVGLGFGFNIFFEGIAVTVGPPIAVQPKTGTKKSTLAAEIDIPSSDLHVTTSDKNINLESKTSIQPKTGTEKSTFVAAEVDIPSSDLHAIANDKNRNLESKSSIQPKTGTKKSTLAAEVDIPSNDLHATASDKNRNLESKSSIQLKTGTKKSTVAAEVDIPSSDLHVTASDKNINLESKTSIQPKTRTEKSTSVAPEVDIPSSDLHVTANDKNINLESKSSIQPKTGTEKSTFVAAEVDIPSSDLHATYSQ